MCKLALTYENQQHHIIRMKKVWSRCKATYAANQGVVCIIKQANNAIVCELTVIDTIAYTRLRRVKGNWDTHAIAHYAGIGESVRPGHIQRKWTAFRVHIGMWVCGACVNFWRHTWRVQIFKHRGPSKRWWRKCGVDLVMCAA